MAGIAAGSLFAPTADAAVIVDQQPTAGIGLLSTFFTLQPGISVAEIDSFTTTTAYRLGTLTAFSSSDGPGPHHLGHRFDLLRWATRRSGRGPDHDGVRDAGR